MNLTHNQRALDATLRRFPHLLGLCRDFGTRDWSIVDAVKLRLPIIIAEYRRVLGRS